VAVLVHQAEHLPLVRDLKQDEALRDVPVLYLLGDRGPGGDDQGQRQEEARLALRAGCDDVLLGALGDTLPGALGAIWGWYQGHGFSPPSGHNFHFSRGARRQAQRPTREEDHITLYGTHHFTLGDQGSPHVLLVSTREAFRVGGQEVLQSIGCHVSYMDSAFLASQFLRRLATHTAPETPAELQGKLDLVIVALEGGLGNAMPLVRHLKGSPDFAQVPLLLLATHSQGHASLRPYHGQGVYLDVDPAPQPGDLVFRVHEVFNSRAQSPRLQGRYLCATRCTWSHEAAPQDQPWRSAMTFNLSPRGLYVRTLTPPPQGQRLRLRLRLRAHGVLLEFSGRVVWSNPWSPSSRRAYPQGFGVLLEEASRSHFEALADHCDLLRESARITPQDQRPQEGDAASDHGAASTPS
jgi:Tfp pilus assembly protein PilZ